MKKSIVLLSGLSVLLLCVGGCGQSTPDRSSQGAAAAASAPANLRDALSQRGIDKAKLAALPTGDPSVSDDAYFELSSGNQVMFLYLGLSPIAVDYDKVAQAYSQEYRAATTGSRSTTSQRRSSRESTPKSPMQRFAGTFIPP